MHAPKVTVNIPAYNAEKYIAKAIESVLSQDYDNLEIIVNDDNSSDKTFEIASRYSDRNGVKVYRNTSTLGRVGNYRKLLYEYASGDWVVNLDGDDYYTDPSFVSEGIRQIYNHENVVEYIAGAICYDEKTDRSTLNPIHLEQELMVLPGKEYLTRIRSMGQVTQHSAILYNRKMAIQTDFYSLDALGSDTDSILRLALKGQVVIHKKHVVAWTSHGDNESYKLTYSNVHKEIRMFERVADAARDHLPHDIVDSWLKQQKKIKTMESLANTYSRLPLGQAWSLFFRNIRFNFQNVKELAKLLLRTAGLRKRML